MPVKQFWAHLQLAPNFMCMNKKQTVRWAIIGAGNIARAFVKDFALMQHATLVAIASSSKSRALEFSAIHGIPRVLSYEELYNSPDVDAVYIATTHNFHFEQALSCLQNGKAVLCEKPVTVNDTQFARLMSVSKANNVFLMEAMWTYFLPAVQKAKAWIQEGRIGKIKMIQADFAFSPPQNLEGRLYNPQLAGGSLLDVGIYPIAIAYFFMNTPPQKITSAARMAITGVDESVAMILDYADASANLFCSVTTKMKNSAFIFGETGYIELPFFHKAWEAKCFDRDFLLTDSFSDGRASHGFIYEMQHANDMILNGEKESSIMTQQRSMDIQQTMKIIRDQAGLKYPFE